MNTERWIVGLRSLAASCDMKLTGKECLGAIATLLVLFAAIFGLVCAIYMFNTDMKSPPIESGTQRTLVTAAHLGEIDGYTQVYVDEDTDFAIYVKEDYIAEGLSLSDVVSLAGTTGTVSSVSWQEFSVVVDDISKIVPGVSGEPVCLNNTPIGFISGWDGHGSLRCIFY